MKVAACENWRETVSFFLSLRGGVIQTVAPACILPGFIATTPFFRFSLRTGELNFLLTNISASHEKKENKNPSAKGGMGGRHAATQGF